MDTPNILLVTFPAQGHINPSLQFAKNLTKLGAKVTFLTSSSATSRMAKASEHDRTSGVIEFISFSDGYDGWTKDSSVDDLMSAIDKHGSKAVAEIILARREQGRPFSRLVYTLLIPWAGRVAYSLNVPVTLLWIQPATLFDIYYYYFNGFIRDPDCDIIELPGLQTLQPSDLPSFLLPSNPNVYNFALPLIKESFEMLDRERDRPTVLVNTFEALEGEPLRVMEKYKLTAIGPLIPSAFLDGKDPSDKSFGGDLIQKSVDYMEWLDSKEESSVIYIAFGSYSEVAKAQVDHLSQGLIMTTKPFLWVIRGSEDKGKLDEILSCREELERQGMIVPWCTQVEVLSHPSVGCFVTHCGWNSSLESIVSGIPVVGLPQWSDQATNAKLLQDYWKTGVKATRSEDGSVIEGEEIKRCLEIAMDGERGQEMRKQAKKLRDLAKEAVGEQGTSNVNLKLFIESVVAGQFDQ